jgi:hypothetical protein
MIYGLTDGQDDHSGDFNVGQARLHKRGMPDTFAKNRIGNTLYSPLDFGFINSRNKREAFQKLDRRSEILNCINDK